ncbi:NAD(P)/FAD-dependent oxidoreductase [Chiayiivirga flava]|uniref:D-amino-acid dehydrogenase n=1 Tax=Chiayiivirga flava TaxID=659595 RepID=A0A7W8D7I1_9GAMM|nr:FAD-dependent oxidoreductase [Chiayiivirga flava]MBB5209381.1 D-amino-acid dehydrogenase [Chiayiivirga flava]
MPPRDDVLILGAGVIGLFCALELLRSGRQVTVLDRGAVGAGASHGNCGTITPSHANPLAMPGVIGKALGWMLQADAPFYVKPRIDPALWRWLLRFARRCNARDYAAGLARKGAWLKASRVLLAQTIAEEGLACEFDASGLLYVYRDAASLPAAHALAADLGGLGIEAVPLDGPALAREEPALRPGMAGGLLFPGDAVLRPDRLVSELARRVRELGGRIEEHSEVVGFVRDRAGNIASVATSTGARTARDVVLALGAWSPTLARGLGLRLPVQPGKGYSITYSRPALAPRRPLVLRERSVCVTAWSSGFRLGSTMEFSGYDSSLNRVRLDALVRGAGEYLREPVGPQLQEEWYGWRPMTWDDLPIVGRAPGLPNLMLATGHGMMGVSMSAITARLVGDLLLRREPVIDPSTCAPERFA